MSKCARPPFSITFIILKFNQTIILLQNTILSKYLQKQMCFKEMSTKKKMLLEFFVLLFLFFRSYRLLIALFIGNISFM